MAGKKIRIGVAGLGRIGWAFHCPALAGSKDLELAAVQDPLADRRAEAQKTYGCSGYAGFDEMLKSANLDAVTIAAPTHLHREMSLAAFAAGCDVMLEKPMAPTSRDAAAIVRGAQKAGRVLTVYQPRRAVAWFQQLKKILEAGTIGEVYHYKMGWYQFTVRNDWQALRKYGGGMLNNYGAHALDQLLQLVGYDIRRVWCSLRVVASLGDAEDVVKVTLETPTGVVADLDINQSSTLKPYDLCVWGSRGSLTLSPDQESFTITSFSPTAAGGRKLVEDLASVGRKYPDGKIPMKTTVVKVNQKLGVDVYADFARAVRERSAPFVKPEEPLAVMRLIDRCRADARSILRTSAWSGT